jgi:hypothetical protein
VTAYWLTDVDLLSVVPRKDQQWSAKGAGFLSPGHSEPASDALGSGWVGPRGLKRHHSLCNGRRGSTALPLNSCGRAALPRVAAPPKLQPTRAKAREITPRRSLNVLRPAY